MSDANPSAPPPGAQPLWGSPQASGGAGRSPARHRPAGAGTPLEPLSQRLLRLAGLLSVLLLLVVANSLLHSDENPLNPVAVAAERTERAPGSRFDLKVVYSSSALPAPIAGSGHGAANSATGRSRAELHMVVAGKSIWLETIDDGTSTYTRGNTIGAELPPGKTWLKVEPFLGHSESEAMVGGDTMSPMKMLASTGSVALVSHEKIDGRMTRRYRAVVELSDYAGLLRAEGKDDLADEYEKVAQTMPTPVTSEVWIDRHSLVRRNRIIMTFPTSPGKPPVSMDMVMDLRDFGAEPKISLPDPSQVYDATPALREGLEAAGTST